MSKLNIGQTEWDLSPLFKSDDDTAMAGARAKVKAASDDFVSKWRERSDYLTEPTVLRQALDEYEAWGADYGVEGDEGFYFWLRTSQDENDPKLKAKNQQITDFGNDNLNSIQFFELNIAKIDPALHDQFLSASELAPYRHWLERLFASAKHQLTESEEKILNLKSTTAYVNWVKLTSGFLVKAKRAVLTETGKREPKNYEELLALMTNHDAKVRDSAAEGFNAIMVEYAEVAEAELNSILADKKVNDELRGFERADASRHLADDVSTEMVDALVQTVSSHNQLANRFYELKAKLLGLPKLKYHERNIEYGKLDQKYTYPEATDLVHGVFTSLDPDFGEIFQTYVENAKIDVFPRAGKTGGAFCVDILKSEPTFVLLNYTDKLKDVTTLAHEMGHAVNSEYRRRAQNSLNFGVPMATAEVASQFMEDFVLDELVAKADPELKLAIQVSRLNDAVSSIFRQIGCYKFEQAIHQAFRQQGYLSKEEIGKLFQQEMSAYMGPAVEQSPGSENWWVYWSHIRKYFYVYAYAGGLLIAKAMQNQVRKDKRFVEQVKTFMSAGRSKSPAEIFADMGLDVTKPKFWSDGLAEIEHLLDETTALAKELKKF